MKIRDEIDFKGVKYIVRDLVASMTERVILIVEKKGEENSDYKILIQRDDF